MRRKITDEDRKDIKVLASKGYGAFAISREIGLEKSYVEGYMKRNNIEVIEVSEGKIKKITPEDGKKMLELTEEGSTVKELAESFGYRIGTVEHYIKDNYQGERRGRKRTKITPVMKEEIIKLYKDGMGISAIVPRMHSNKDAIISVLKEAGLKIEYGGGKVKDYYEELKPIIAKLYDEGYCAEVISREVHTSADKVRELLKEMGYKLHAGGRGIDIHNMNPDKKNRVISLGRAGVTMACIHRRTGLSEGVVRKILIEEKLFIPRKERGQEGQEIQEEWQPRYSRVSFETFEMNEFNKAHRVEGIKVKPIPQAERKVKMVDGTERTMEDLVKEFEAQQKQSK